jgi:hypothetical protein
MMDGRRVIRRREGCGGGEGPGTRPHTPVPTRRIAPAASGPRYGPAAPPLPLAPLPPLRLGEIDIASHGAGGKKKGREVDVLWCNF